MEPDEFGRKLQKSLAEHGIKFKKIDVVYTPGVQVFNYLEDENYEGLQQYIVAYCNRNGHTLRDLFMGRGGGPNRNDDDFDSVPLQKAAIAMWNRWSDKQKIYSIKLSLEKNEKSLEDLLTDECEQVREGAKLYVDSQRIKENDCG